MIPVRRFVLACAGGLLLAPFAAVAQSDTQPDTTAPAAETPPAQPEGETAKEEAAADNKRVCRSVRADPSSRRKTKVCRTVEEWRELNVPV